MRITDIKIVSGAVARPACGGVLKFEGAADRIELRCVKCHKTAMSAEIEGDDNVGNYNYSRC